MLILAALRAAGDRVSGQALSARLGISRVALWKRIERLKRFAYRIDGDHGGYRLVEEDAVVPAAFPDGRGVIYKQRHRLDHGRGLGPGGGGRTRPAPW